MIWYFLPACLLVLPNRRIEFLSKQIQNIYGFPVVDYKCPLFVPSFRNSIIVARLNREVLPRNTVLLNKKKIVKEREKLSSFFAVNGLRSLRCFYADLSGFKEGLDSFIWGENQCSISGSKSGSGSTCFGPPGCGSISQRYGSGSGYISASFYHQVNIVRKILISSVF